MDRPELPAPATSAPNPVGKEKGAPISRDALNSVKIFSEDQVRAQLQEPWAANRVLDDAQAALRGYLWRTVVVRKEDYVVVGSVEIGMVENIERIGFKT